MQLNAYQAYQENQVKTADRPRLVVTLYEEAIRYLKEAVQAFKEGDHERKGERLVFGMEVISELLASLDTEAGGEIAKNLKGLYTYMLQRLVLADAEGDPEKVQEVISLLQELLEAWKEVSHRR